MPLPRAIHISPWLMFLAFLAASSESTPRPAKIDSIVDFAFSGAAALGAINGAVAASTASGCAMPNRSATEASVWEDIQPFFCASDRAGAFACSNCGTNGVWSEPGGVRYGIICALKGVWSEPGGVLNRRSCVGRGVWSEPGGVLNRASCTIGCCCCCS